MSLSLIAALLVSGPFRKPDLIDLVRHTLVKAPFSETSLEGDATFFGCESKFVFTFGPDGRFVRQVTGPLPNTVGFDGKTLWQQDATGAPRTLGFEDGEEERFLALLSTDRWLDPKAEDKVRVDPGKPNVLDVEMPGGLSSQVTIDPTTNEPLTATYETTDGHNQVDMKNWTDVSGNLFPYSMTMDTAGVKDEYRVTSAKPGAASYGYPQWTATDTTFDPSKSPVIETKAPQFGVILVHPMVNGKDVGWFILDSGAGTMAIDPKVADDLGLTKIGVQPVTGVGGTILEAFRPGATVSLGPITVKNLIFSEIDLGDISVALKAKIAGIVGADIFRRSVVTVDPVKPEVAIYDPASYKLPKGTSWSQMDFDGGNPVVQAVLEGDRKAWYRLDTGDSGSVTFHEPYVKKEHLLDDRSTINVANEGVGGSTAAKQGKISWFQLGTYRFNNPEVVFSLAEKGAFSNRYLAGNIGQTFMKPFTVAFDFGDNRVGFIQKG